MRTLCLLLLVVSAGCDHEVPLAIGEDGGVTDAAMTPADGGGPGVDLAGTSLCALGDDTVACDTSNDPCPALGAHCERFGADIPNACVCNMRVCTVGADQTCNDDPAMQSILGHCTQAGTCTCGAGSTLSPTTGKCASVACPADPPANGTSCPSEGQRCDYQGETCMCLTTSGMAGSMPTWACFMP